MNFIDIGSLMYGFHRRMLTNDTDHVSQASEIKALTPGQVADAIEAYGCYGFDKYGRFIGPEHTDEGEIKAGALKAVADTYKAYLETDFDCKHEECYLDQFFEHDMSIRRYGWEDSKLPSFGDPALIAQPTPKSRGSSVNTQVVLIDGLIQLANDNDKVKFDFDLDWLFEHAGYPDLNKRGELAGLNSALEKKTGRNLKPETLKNLLEQLGRRK